ncbi:MAG: amidohydrolase family protein [Gemmatales bacterium]|nr:amidohydrolase family protein [Gemmatales bacterium]MDW8175440.1 amidohydrolase family protein [Gemmatales bacterium]
MPDLGVRWLFDGKGVTYEEALLVWEDGRVVAVEPNRARRAKIYLRQAIILPGLVNAHTHLDLSTLRAEELPRAACAWLNRVIAHRRQATPEIVAEAVQRGIRESLRCGVTLVGDIAGSPQTLLYLNGACLRARVFVEVVGLSRSRARATWRTARQLLTSKSETTFVRLGLSPHAPYSTRRSLFRLAARSGWPLAIHWAEFAEERDLLITRAGPFRDWLEALGVWEERGLVSDYDELLDLITPAPKTLFIHLNYPDTSLKHVLPVWASQGRAGVVYCPRTHAYFGHMAHSWLRWLEQEVPVVFGTDSLASNPDLNVLNELRFLWSRGCPLAPAQLFQRVTHTAAELLGWPETGALCPGQWADFVVMPLTDSRVSNPLQSLLESQVLPQYVYVAGQLVFDAAHSG